MQRIHTEALYYERNQRYWLCNRHCLWKQRHLHDVVFDSLIFPLCHITNIPQITLKFFRQSFDKNVKHNSCINIDQISILTGPLSFVYSLCDVMIPVIFSSLDALSLYWQKLKIQRTHQPTLLHNTWHIVIPSSVWAYPILI